MSGVRSTDFLILLKKRYAYLVVENLGNFQISKEGIVVPHVYNVGCYFHICLLGFPRTFNYDVALQYHVPVLNTRTARLFIIGYIHK